MSSEAEVVEKEAEVKKTHQSPFVALLELEGVAVQARQAEFEALKSLLGEQKKKLTPHVYVRHCLNASPAAYLPALLDALGDKRQVTDKLIEEIRSGVAMFLSSDDATLNPIVKSLLDAAKKKDMRVALLTNYKESIAESLVEKWGLKGIQLFAHESADRLYPRADVLLKVAKALSCTPRQCVVLAGSQFSAKAALSAGMRCIAVPDSFTGFQDFSGADVVIDDADGLDAKAVLDQVTPLQAIQ